VGGIDTQPVTEIAAAHTDVIADQISDSEDTLKLFNIAEGTVLHDQ